METDAQIPVVWERAFSSTAVCGRTLIEQQRKVLGGVELPRSDWPGDHLLQQGTPFVFTRLMLGDRAAGHDPRDPIECPMHRAPLCLSADTPIGPVVARDDHPGLALLGELTEAGTITPAIDRSYPLAEAPQAIGYVGAGTARGKVVVKVK